MTAGTKRDGAPGDGATDDVVTVRRRLSPSRAADFLTCPLLFRYRSIDRLPEPPSPVAARGTLVHAVLEELFDQPPARRTPDVARSLVPAAWQRVMAEDARLVDLFQPQPDGDPSDDPERDAWFASVDALLEAYFRLENPQTLEPAEREVRVEGVAGDAPEPVKLTGIIDRVDVAPDGRIRLVDYKSGRSPGERFEGQALFQMKFYALVVWRTRGVMPSLLQLMYLGDGQVLRYVPTEPDLLATERKLLAIWSAIDAALAAGSFAPRPSGLCRFCAHRDVCPEGGGQVLPMPVTRVE